jgi:iduronate 2-sulfatase
MVKKYRISGSREIILFTLFALMSSQTGMCQSAQATNPPYNVLFISVDDLRPLLGCYGATGVYSPHIDALASQGTLFTRAYAQQAWCSPSRTSLLTGLRPDRTRVYDLETHFRTTVPDAVTLPQYFKQHGYLVASLGKVFHESLDDSLSWSIPAWLPAVEDPLRHYVRTENSANAVQRRGYAAPTECAPVADEAYPDGQITAQAIQMLNRLAGKPFFLAVGFYKPHLPFTAPEKYWQLYDPLKLPLPAFTHAPINAPPYAFMKRAEHHNYVGVPAIPNGTPLPDSLTRNLIHGYYACVSYIDAQVGLLIDALRQLNLADNTIVVLWGDHGWKLGEYGSWSKHTNYEIDTRVPLIIRAPGQGKPGLQTGALTELLDVYPTLTDLAGLPAPGGVQGQSLRPLMFGREKKHKQAVFSQFIRNVTLTHTSYADAVVLGQTVRTDQYRLVRWIDRNNPKRTIASELYNHLTDPHETINQASNPEFEQVVKQLTKLLDQNFTPEPG